MKVGEENYIFMFSAAICMFFLLLETPAGNGRFQHHHLGTVAKARSKVCLPTASQGRRQKKPCLYHHKVQQEKNQQPKTRKPAPTPTPDLKDGRPKRVRKSDTSRQEVVTNGQLGW